MMPIDMLLKDIEKTTGSVVTEPALDDDNGVREVLKGWGVIDVVAQVDGGGVGRA
jgi:hypothetical protein